MIDVSFQSFTQHCRTGHQELLVVKGNTSVAYVQLFVPEEIYPLTKRAYILRPGYIDLQIIG
jgi:hypothetical protein